MGIGVQSVEANKHCLPGPDGRLPYLKKDLFAKRT